MVTCCVHYLFSWLALWSLAYVESIPLLVTYCHYMLGRFVCTIML